MKYILITIIFLFTSTGFAVSKEKVTLDMALSIDGKLVSKPTVVSLSGETANITSSSNDGDGYYVEVTPTLLNNKEVFMKIVVGKLNKGIKTIISKPQVRSVLGEQAEVTQELKEGQHKKLSLSVTAKL